MTGGAAGLSALALAFGVCCVAPWAVTLLGVAGAVLLARLAFLQPYVVAATIVLLCIGFWFAYRRPLPAAACDLVQRRRSRRLVWGRMSWCSTVRIGGSDKDIPAAAELLHTTLARHYWNPTGDFGRQMSQVLGLLHGSSPVYAWDIYMIYPPNAVWSRQDPPQPAYLMHQLPGLDNQKFPPWDGKLFATKVSDTLAAGVQKYCAPTTACCADVRTTYE